MAPTASAANAAIASSTTRSSTGRPLPGIADDGVGADVHALKRDIGRRAAVLRGLAAPRHAGGLAVDEEQADAARVAPAAAGARGDDQLVGAVAMSTTNFSPSSV